MVAQCARTRDDAQLCVLTVRRAAAGAGAAAADLSSELVHDWISTARGRGVRDWGHVRGASTAARTATRRAPIGSHGAGYTARAATWDADGLVAAVAGKETHRSIPV